MIGRSRLMPRQPAENLKAVILVVGVADVAKKQPEKITDQGETSHSCNTRRGLHYSLVLRSGSTRPFDCN